MARCSTWSELWLSENGNAMAQYFRHEMGASYPFAFAGVALNCLLNGNSRRVGLHRVSVAIHLCGWGQFDRDGSSCEYGRQR